MRFAQRPEETLVVSLEFAPGLETAITAHSVLIRSATHVGKSNASVGYSASESVNARRHQVLESAAAVYRLLEMCQV